jgi:hypothetical protein
VVGNGSKSVALEASLGKAASHVPDRSHHVASRFVQTVRKTANGYEIVPVCVMLRRSGGILWQ